MEIEAGVVAFFKADAGIGAVLGDRIYPGVLPQGWTTPSCRYQKISSVKTRSLGGPSGSASSRLQLDVFARRSDGVTGYAQAKAAVAAIRSAFNTKSAEIGAGARILFGTVTISGLVIEEERDADYDDDSEDFRVILEVFIRHAES